MNNKYKKKLVKGESFASDYYLCCPEKTLSGISGSLLGYSTGSSLEFMEHREYMPGDDLRYIDWNVYARTDKLALKLYREEVSPSVDILIDTSASMSLGDTDKDEASLLLSAFITGISLNSGYNTKVWAAGNEVTPVSDEAAAPSNWRTVKFDGKISPFRAIISSAFKFRYRSIRFFVSDFMWEDDPSLFLSRFASDSAFSVVCRIISERDIHPNLPYGNIRIIDSETDSEQEVLYDYNSEQIYTKALERHTENWISACKQYNVLFFSFISENFDLNEVMAVFLRYALLRTRV